MDEEGVISLDVDVSGDGTVTDAVCGCIAPADDATLVDADANAPPVGLTASLLAFTTESHGADISFTEVPIKLAVLDAVPATTAAAVMPAANAEEVGEGGGASSGACGIADPRAGKLLGDGGAGFSS